LTEAVNIDLKYLREWIGKTELASDVVTPMPIAALSATLDRNDPFPQIGDSLPPLWNWLYFLPIHPMSGLGKDGHAKRGGFLPPVPLPRRMIAGGRLEFRHSLRVGDGISRLSRILDVDYKEGRSGPLVFVRIRHEIKSGNNLALVEEQDIVYRQHPKPSESVPKPQKPSYVALWTREIYPSDVLLFSYSALTFNGHRIHYDRRFATDIEGYPGLVVHGPLIATLLLDLVRRKLPELRIFHFSFRAVRPLFDISQFSLFGRTEEGGKVVKLWATDVDGYLAMDASAVLA
jgi:3-methylfumaryl-CoA hydratase